MPEQADLFRMGIQLYTDVCGWAVPMAFAIGIGNVILNTFFSAAFGGRLKIGGK